MPRVQEKPHRLDTLTVAVSTGCVSNRKRNIVIYKVIYKLRQIRRAGIYAAEIRKNRRSGSNFPATTLCYMPLYYISIVL